MSEDTETTVEEQQEKPESDNKILARSVFESSRDAGMNRDATVVAMIQAGLTLNTAQILYKDLAKEAGVEVVRGGHKTEAIQLLKDSNIDDEEFVKTEVRTKLREQLRERFKVAESTANDYLKAYAVELGLTLPGSGGPSSEMSGHIFDFVMASPNCDKAAFKEFMEGYNRSKGNIDENWRGVLLARRLLAAGYEYEEPEEEEEEEDEEAA